MKDPADVLTTEMQYLYRSKDPVTSKDAAASTACFTARFKNLILQALREKPGTFQEISERTGLRPDQVWRRLSDLERDNLAFPTGETRKGSSGRQQRVWRAWE